MARPPLDPRADAARILAGAMTGRDRSTDLLNRRLRDYPPDSRDRGLLSELVMGVLRRRLALAAVLAPQLRRPLESTDAVLRELLLVLAYQALFLGRIPPHARVAATVAAARSRAGEPAARFVNAIGRGLERRLAAGDVLADLDAPTLWSVPGPVLAQARAADGAAWDDGCLPAFAAHAPSVLRVNRAAMSRDDARARLAERGVVTDPAAWAPDGLVVREGTPLADPEWVPRRLLPQDEASQLVVHALDPRPGETVVDLCAGTGVKTSQILALAPGADVLAVDLDGRKLERAVTLCRDQGLPAARTLACDARGLPAERDGTADAVLLDAPCTGLGTLVRRPEVRYLRTADDVARAAALQREILAAALRLLKPGGRLVYAVCSFAPAEGPEVVDAVLAGAAGFVREAIPLDAPFRTADGALAPRPWRDGMDGFWVARVRRLQGGGL